MNYYNEWDKGAAAWLRELIKAGHIPQGYVDERSIAEVTPGDLEGFTQCHFFAGIGGWPLALNMAGVRADQRLWTGSPPCQPFSTAGKQLGQLDERHLAPTFMRLVAQCRPAVLFGEQVAAAIGKHWLDDLFAELEKQGYACGAAVLPACSVGAPHKRDRLFFGATFQLADTDSGGRWPRGEFGSVDAVPQLGEDHVLPPAKRDSYRNMADANHARPQGRQRVSECAAEFVAGPGGVDSGLGNPSMFCSSDSDPGSLGSTQCTKQSETRKGYGEADRASGRACEMAKSGDGARQPREQRADPNHSFWSDADWLGCRDGKFRPVEPGTFPVGNGFPCRVGRLRGYGNAIVPQVAAEFIRAFMVGVEL